MSWKRLFLYGLPIIAISLFIILSNDKPEESFLGIENPNKLETQNNLVLDEQLKLYRSATLRYKFNREGYMEIVDQADRELGKLGFVVTGKINGEKQTRTSQDFTWTKTINEEIVNRSRQVIIWNDETNETEEITLDESYSVYEMVASNNNNRFPWTVTLDFDKNNDIKITHDLTNNLGVDITDTKFWYVNVVPKETKITYDNRDYYVNETSIQRSGDFNNIKPIARIGNYNFEFQDLINEGFDITNVYVGNGSIINRDNIYLIGIGVTKGSGVFQDGQSITLDPTTSDWIEPHEVVNIWTGQFDNPNRTFLADGLYANSSVSKSNISLYFNILESEGGPVPDESLIEGLEFSAYAGIDSTPGSMTLLAFALFGAEYLGDPVGDFPFATWGTTGFSAKTFADSGTVPVGHFGWFRKWEYFQLNNFSFAPTVNIASTNKEVRIDQYRMRVYYNAPPVLNNSDDKRFLRNSIGDGAVINRNNTLIYLPFDISQMAFNNYTSSGTDWYDDFQHISGNGGSFEIVPGIYGDAYKFDATTEPYLSAGYREHKRGLTNLTISVWVNMTSTTTRTIIAEDFTSSFSGADVSYRLQNTASFPQLITMNNTVPFGRANWKTCGGSGLQIPQGVWSHIVATYNGSTVKLYVNGTLSLTCTNQQGELRSVSGFTTNLGITRIGCRYQAPNIMGCWDDGMDELMLLDVALNDSEILDLYNGTISRVYPRSEKEFRELSLTGTNNTINISITSATPLDSSINVSIGDGSSGTYIYGPEIAFPYTDITPDNPSNFSVKSILYASENNFLSPVMNNTIGIGEWEVGVADSCTYISGNWFIVDNCVLTSNIIGDMNANISLNSGGNLTFGNYNISGFQYAFITVGKLDLGGLL